MIDTTTRPFRSLSFVYMAPLSWFLPGFLLILRATALGGENTRPLLEKEFKMLIDQLVSPNPKPITGDEDENEAPDYRLPAGFDRKKQEQVHRARVKLRQLGPSAFPYLIERWGDKRYCLTTSHGLSGYCHNESVGDVCRAIVFDQLQPYSFWPKRDDDPRGKPKRPSYPDRFLGTDQSAMKWFEKNKHKPLFDLQLEVVDWVIAGEAKRPRDFTDAEREELQQIRRKLVESKKPLPPGSFNLTDIEE